jgi:hypothetical protein
MLSCLVYIPVHELKVGHPDTMLEIPYPCTSQAIVSML